MLTYLLKQLEDDVKKILLDAEKNYNTSSGVKKTWDKLHHEVCF